MKYNMKEKMLPFAFSKGEVATARMISEHGALSIRDLSNLLGKLESSISQTVKSLEEKGIVKTKRHGMKKLVDISDHNYAISLREVFRAEPYVPWEEKISNSNIVALFVNITGEESFKLGISSTSSWRANHNLSMHGMYSSAPGKQSLRNSNLSRFIIEYSDHVSRRYLSEKLPREAFILWRSGYRCLFKTRGHAGRKHEILPNQTFPTALTVLPTYGIQLLTHDLYYYHEPNLTELALEDVILHTLLIDPESQTYSTYALLLALKNKRIIDMNLLLEKSRKYKIVDLARNLVKYIESNGRIREWPLPDPNELQEQTDLYGVRMG
jgi:DNA-binding transcriptional ArsR family regulator